MKPETVLKLNRFQLRPYQTPILDAIENKKYKRVVAILPRRAGKDFACWILMIRAALKKVGIYWYIFPTYSQGRKILWDGITSDGVRFIDFLPPELIASQNSQLMQIKLTNGSIIQVIGSDNVDSLVGSNPLGCVFSEYALQDPRAYQFLRPVLTANNGFAVFISTPRGKNNLWELWNIAQNNPKDWFAYKMTVAETGHIPLHEIERERHSGEMSDDLIAQEYYVSFEMGVEGAYYTKYLDRMRLKGQIGCVDWEPSFKVHTAWDIGYSDETSIIFFQTIGQTIRIIDCYAKAKEGLEHYAKVLQNKPYTYGRHIGPHDIAVHEWTSGITRIEKAKQLGIRFTVADNISIVDGIEAVRSTLPKVWIDEKNCAPLLKALESYRQEWDSKRQVYKDRPLHDKFSHYADAMRYLCISLPKTRDGLSPEDLDKRYQEAVYGSTNVNMPAIFRDDLPDY